MAVLSKRPLIYFVNMEINYMNLDAIKREGAILGLEAELNRQRQILADKVKMKEWNLALQATNNIQEVLQEFLNLGKSCALTSPEQSST